MKDQSKTKKALIQTEASLDKASEYTESIINTVREPLIILDHDLRVVNASRSFYEFFKVKPEETEGQLSIDTGLSINLIMTANIKQYDFLVGHH